MREPLASTHSHFRALSAALLTSTLLFSSAAPARAQIGGPNTPRRPPANPSARVENSSAKAAPAVINRRYEKEGVAVEFTLATPPGEQGRKGLVAGADAVATFAVRDTRTGQPLTGLHPNAWMSSLKSGLPVPNEAECRDRIRTFMGGLLSARAEIDMNSYLVLTLNHDATVSVINPQVAFQITKLENLIPLPGRGADWALSPDKNSLYVSVPESSAVVFIDTLTRKAAETVSTGEGTTPRRVALSPDGRSLWVSLDGSPRVAVLDTQTRKPRGTVELGAGGLHSVAFTPDGLYAYVSSSDGQSVSAVDAKTLRKLADIRVGETPGPVAYSTASRHVYAAAVNAERLSVIDPAKQEVVASVPVGRGTVALRFDPSGRYAFAVNQKESTVTVVDSATRTAVGTTSVTNSPDQVVFTPGFAYIRGTGSEKFSLIGLKELAAGKLSPVDVQAGQRPPKESPADLGIADMIAATPEGNSAMIANAPDGMIYYYVQGMMAPMGTISNYKRRANAIMLLDRSLSEVRPGVYSTPVKLRGAGRFNVSLLIDQPRVVNCFEVEVAPSPDGEGEKPGTSLAVETQFKGLRTAPRKAVPLRFKLRDTATGAPVPGLRDVMVLVFQPPGIWQQRQWAAEVGDGVYEITQTFPHQGMFNVMFKVASRGVEFRNLPFTEVTVVEEAKTDAKTNEK
jgi:YVTN family beta-propeller protein